MQFKYFMVLYMIGFSIVADAQQSKVERALCIARTALSSRLDTAASRGLVDHYLVWDNNKEISCKILSGSKSLQQLIRKAAVEWEQYANIRFKFVDEGFSHIRILPTQNKGNKSVIGTEAMNVPEDEPTMVIDTSYYKASVEDPYLYATLLHEFGHVLGLLHEHAHPGSEIKWNKEAIMKFLMEQYPNDWAGANNKPREEAYKLFTEQFSAYYTNGTAYDNKSIMHYPILAKFTLDGYSTNSNFSLSEGDKTLVGALYPKSKRTETNPRVSVAAFNAVYSYDAAKKTAVIDLDYQVDFAGATSKFYVVAFLVNKENEYIEDDNETFNIQGVKGVFEQRLLHSADTATKLPMRSQLFIPAAELPKEPSDVASIHIACYVRNEQTSEMKRIFSKQYSAVTR